MRQRGVEPTVTTFGTLICIAADCGSSAHVRQAWDWLQATGLETHVACVNAYLQALVSDVSNPHPTAQTSGLWPTPGALGGSGFQ